MRSLRTTLTLSTAIGTAVVLSAAGVLLYASMRTSLIEQFDRSLADKVRLLASTLEQEDQSVEIDFEEFDMREFEGPNARAYLQLWLDDGTVLFRSPGLPTEGLEPVAASIESPEYGWVSLPGGRAGRAVGVVFTPRMEGHEEGEAEDSAEHARKPARATTLVLARDTAPIEEKLAGLKALLITVGLVTVAVSLGLLWLVIQWSLRPVGQLAVEIGGLDEQDLSARVDFPDVPAELRPVPERLNELLGRLESAFLRERCFSADVAHELRTPLAGLLSTMDVTLSRPRQGEDYQQALDRCRQIALEMQGMVENLMSLARLEAGRFQIQPEPVVPNQLIRDCWKSYVEPAQSRGLEVRWALGPDDPLVTDPSLLGLVLRNLLDNAVDYTEEGGWVKIETAPEDGRLDVRVANSGSTLSPDEVQHVFERFWRGDAARSATGVHSGLGLPLVKKIAAALGGSVEVRSTPGGPFEITLSIPRG